MTLLLEGLDIGTRTFMLSEFDAEERGLAPYRSPLLAVPGLEAWPHLMREAIAASDEFWLSREINDVTFWHLTDARGRRVNVRQASDRLATSEFNTWYVRGLSRRLIAEGESQCEIYRAAEPKWEVASCAQHEGELVDLHVVYGGHRRRYWPHEDLTAFSIPFQPRCHHSIRRLVA